MCVNPILIRNPNYKRKCRLGSFDSFKDCSSLYIRVPCGHCIDCIQSKQMSIVQRSQMMNLDYHVFFGTLTYDNKHLPYLYTSSGIKITYADISHIQKMFKRIRKGNLFTRDFKYLVVSERGSLKGRPHFHLLLYVRKLDNDNYLDILNLEDLIFNTLKCEWRVNVGSSRTPIYEPLFKYSRKFIKGRLSTNFDLHFVNPRFGNDENSVVFYCTKYMLKDSLSQRSFYYALKNNYDYDEFKYLWSKVRNRVLMSKDFGNSHSPAVKLYIKQCIYESVNDSDSTAPSFFNPDNGQSFPLSRYFQRKFLTVEDKLHYYFKNNRGTGRLDSVMDDNRTCVEFVTDNLKNISKNETLQKIHSLPTSFDSAFE